MNVLYRAHAGEDWIGAEFIRQRADGQLVLREVRPFCPGIWLADPMQVRVAVPRLSPDEIAIWRQQEGA